MEVVAGDEMPTNVKSEVLGKKNDVRLELNYQTGALNSIGNKPDVVVDFYQKVLKMLVTLGYEIDALALFHEVQSNINIKTDTNPREMINKSVKCDLTPFQEITPTIVEGLRLDLPVEQPTERLHVIVEANPTSPKTVMTLRVLYQTIEPDKIIKLSNEIDHRILKFVSSLGGS